MESNDFAPEANRDGMNEGIQDRGTMRADSGDTSEGAIQSQGLADRASSAMSSAKDRLADVGSTVRDRASSAKDSLADALESGAEKLRQRAGGDGMSGAGANGGSIAVTDDRMAQVSTKVAGGMEATADWLRDADLDSLKAGVERQVKEHPGRTLLIAVGLGYLLGKALRK
jgi:ElaB/YqjD/DUF883 family membrane-anchored ribosome-binding protein